MKARERAREALRARVDQIAAELTELGFPPDPEKPVPQVSTAFGYGEMALEQWLSDVFVPNATAAIEANRIPPGSQVGVAAMRNFDGEPEKERLVSLLSEFDHAVVAFVRRYGTAGTPPVPWWRRLLGR